MNDCVIGSGPRSVAVPRPRSFGHATAAVVVNALLESEPQFRRYLAKRLGRPADADDVLQTFFLKAIEGAASLHDGVKLQAWLWRTLRNTLIDHYRRGAARRRLADSMAVERPDLVVGGDQPGALPCACIRALLPRLRPEYAEVLIRADINGESRVAIAATIGITATNVGVRLHRARRALHRRIERSCGASCLDWTANDGACPVLSALAARGAPARGVTEPRRRRH